MPRQPWYIVAAVAMLVLLLIVLLYVFGVFGGGEVAAPTSPAPATGTTG